MTKTSRSLIASLALGLVAVPATALAQQQQQQGQQQRDQQKGGKDAHEASKETIPMDQVPEQARKAIQSWAKDGNIDKVDKVTTKDGKTEYRAHVDRDGKKLEVLVTPEGKVLRSGAEMGD